MAQKLCQYREYNCFKTSSVIHVHVILPSIKFKFWNTAWKNFLSLKWKVASSRIMGISLSEKIGGVWESFDGQNNRKGRFEPYSPNKRDGVMILRYKVFGKDEN